MSFLKNTVSFTRFRVQGVRAEIKENFADRLRQFAFMPIDDTAEEKSYGWTSIEDMEDFAFANFPVRSGDYYFFSFRVDQRRVSPAVLKKHIRKAMADEQEKLAVLGKKYISKERKKEIREQVELRLRAKTLPVPAVYDVVWNTVDNTVHFAGTSKKLLRLFAEYFSRTVNPAPSAAPVITLEDLETALHRSKDEARLIPLLPTVLAERAVRQHENLTFSAVEQTAFTDSCETVSEALIGADSILGEEFLTWLWYRSEVQPFFEYYVSIVKHDLNKRQFHVSFENRLSVRGYNGSNQVSAAVSGAFNPMFEARTGLEKGKKVNKACIVISDAEYHFIFTAEAKNFCFSSFGIQNFKPENGTDQEAELLLRIDCLETAMGYFDEAYEQFLLCRLDQEKWAEEVGKIKDWILHDKK